MQCGNCQFENLPGLKVCGRCGASLELARAAVDVHPPRAGRWSKRWQRWAAPVRRRLPFRMPRMPETGPPRRGARPGAAAVDRLREARSEIAAAWSRLCEAWPRELPPWPVRLRMIVPGWPQRHLGQARRGRLFFTAYAVLLAAGILFFGAWPGAVLLGLAVAVHVGSVLDIVSRQFEELLGGAAQGIVCLLVLAVLVYLPAGWLVTRVAMPQQIVVTVPPFEAGDVILYSPSAYWRSSPQPGDVVVYDATPWRARQPRGPYYQTFYQIEGPRIDRILAGPGDTVVSEDRRLSVNGEPSPWQPLNTSWLPDKMRLTVPAGMYFILPSADFALTPQLAPLWQAEVGLITERHVWGRVYLRHQPLWRWWWIR